MSKSAIIIGSGPAGTTAAIYLQRAGIDTKIIASSINVGGALVNTTKIENFPGFPEGVGGFDLTSKMLKQAENFGAEVLYEDVISADLSKKEVTLSNNESFRADAIVIATGQQYRKLGVSGEEEFSAKGVSYCATCDGAFFRNKKVAVVGGGDTAMEDALFLSNLCEKVYIIHRREEFRASNIMVERVKKKVNIKLLLNKTVDSIKGGKSVENLILNDISNSGEKAELPVSAVFVAIGAFPKTDIFVNQLDMDELGHIKVEARTSKTSAEGIFASGDCIDPKYKQAVIAASSGAVAGIECAEYIHEKC